MANNKKSDNYLNYIPCYNDEYSFDIDDEDKVTILIENKGVFNRLAQKYLKKPKITQIHLDEMGSFIWPLIDGTRSVYDISLLVKEEFGESAEPLYNRIVTYMRTLESYNFVTLKKDGGQI